MLRISWSLLTKVVLGAVVAAGCGSTSDGSGSAVIAGTSCGMDGTQAASADGCNTCECSTGQWVCTETDCATPCTDGERRDDGCNVCACNAGTWSCTRATCLGEGCLEGASTSDGCASCTCSNGMWQCLDVECGGSCREGETIASGDGCNTCSCVDGAWACTNMNCAPPECIDGETRSETCSICTCEGGTWLCQGTPCVEPVCPAPAAQDPQIGCAAVVVYARDPVTGQCCQYGDPCSAPGGWEQFYSMEECVGPAACVPGDVKPADDGCNTCSCGADGTWLCTLTPCVAECLPGQTRRDADGCNTCTCTEQGGWTCTDMPCTGEPIGCGGGLGDTCTGDEYCAYVAGQMCGAADSSAFCEPRPQGCDLMYAPVCGCDLQPYSNACAAASAGTGVLVEGECPPTF